MNLAPMLAITCIALRIRALAIGRRNPQGWAHDAMYFATFGLITTTIVAVVGPMIFGGKVTKGSTEGDVVFEVSNTFLAAIFTAIRYICVFSVNIGLAVVVYAAFVLEPPSGPTPPIATSVATTFILVQMYFMAYVGVWLCTSVHQFGLVSESSIATASQMFDGAKSAIQFAPMVCLLFLGARMRAMQVKGRLAAPQNWAQGCMWGTTCAIMFGVITGFIGPVFTFLDTNPTCAGIMDVLRLLCLVLVHAGALAVVVSLFLIHEGNTGDLGLQDPAGWAKGVVTF